MKPFLKISCLLLVGLLVACPKDSSNDDTILAAAALALSAPSAQLNGSCQLAGAGAKCEALYNSSSSNSTLQTNCQTNLGGTWSTSNTCTTTASGFLGTCKLANKDATAGGLGGGGTTISYRYSGTEPGACQADGGTFAATSVQSP